MHKRSFLFAAAGALIGPPAMALYDPRPSDLLVMALGGWKGSLTYRDYRSPDQVVTLPAEVWISLAAPATLALYYLYEDGPGKRVHSYERMAFDLDRSELEWQSGLDKASLNRYRITSVRQDATGARFEFERPVEARQDRFALEFTLTGWSLVKTEVDAQGRSLQRNRSQYRRV